MPRSSALQHRIALYGGIVIINFITFMACVAQVPSEGNDEEQRLNDDAFYLFLQKQKLATTLMPLWPSSCFWS
jgi:hypothetical protein